MLNRSRINLYTADNLVIAVDLHLNRALEYPGLLRLELYLNTLLLIGF